jgi:hypothetical protein
MLTKKSCAIEIRTPNSCHLIIDPPQKRVKMGVEGRKRIIECFLEDRYLKKIGVDFIEK